MLTEPCTMESIADSYFELNNLMPLSCNWTQMEALGFKQIDDSAYDLRILSFMRPCEFPKGWVKQATEYENYYNLLDDRGRVRGTIFFDYSSGCCTISLRRRYGIVIEPDDSYKKQFKYYSFRFCRSWNAVVYDIDEPIHKVRVRFSVDQLKRVKEMNNVRKGLEDWLKENFAFYNDPLMYWDD